MRRFAWPTDSLPVVEFFGGWRNAIRDEFMLLENRWRPWDQAETWEELCELTAQFCEGKLHATPTHWGPRDEETRGIAAELAHANRQGFLTTNSQPAEACTVTGIDDGRAEVTGLGDEATVNRLAGLVRGTRLVLDVRGWDRGKPLEVTIYDPVVKGGRLLWDRLGQPDWDNPTPPAETAVPTAPKEPPVGTVLETSDDFGTYQIERTDLGWHIRHAGGSDEFGNRLTSFGGRGISWRAAWSAWGPPSGAAPLRELPAGSPPPPPESPESPPAWADMGPDATDQRLDPPPAAQPWTSRGAAVNQATKGAIQGVSQVTPTGLVAKALSGVTGKDIKSPMASATTSSSSSTGGAGVSNIEEAKAGIAKAGEQVQEAQGAAQQVAEQVEEALQSLRQAASGSDQGEYESAEAALQHIKEVAEELVKLLGAAPAELESIRL